MIFIVYEKISIHPFNLENRKKLFKERVLKKNSDLIMNPEDEKVIQKAFFLKEIEKTEKLINRKLDIWKP